MVTVDPRSQSGLPPAQTSPSGGTAVPAAVLSFLGAVYLVLMAVSILWAAIARWDLVGIFGGDPAPNRVYTSIVFSLITAAISAFAGLALLAGGVLLSRRRPAGRWIVVCGCVLAAAWAALVLLAGWTVTYHYFAIVPFVDLNPAITAGVAVVSLLFALLTLVLAVLAVRQAPAGLRRPTPQN